MRKVAAPELNNCTNNIAQTAFNFILPPPPKAWSSSDLVLQQSNLLPPPGYFTRYVEKWNLEMCIRWCLTWACGVNTSGGGQSKPHAICMCNKQTEPSKTRQQSISASYYLSNNVNIIMSSDPHWCNWCIGICRTCGIADVSWVSKHARMSDDGK